MAVLLIIVAAVFFSVGILLWAAMWCVSDEPYEQVAPFKPAAMKTLMSMDDVERNIRAMRAHDELRERGGHAGRWGV